MWNEQIQKRLLVKADLTFTKVIKVALAVETASRDVTELQGEHKHNTRINKMTKGKWKPSATATTTCHLCGANSHVAHECTFEEELCQHTPNKEVSRETSHSIRSKKVHVVESKMDEREDVLGSLEIHNVKRHTVISYG